MNLFWIIASWVAMVATITNIRNAVTDFVHGVRDARSDLNAIRRELTSITATLKQLKTDAIALNEMSLPPTLEVPFKGILISYVSLMTENHRELSKHGTSKAGVILWWSMRGGKGEMAQFHSTLETHSSTLDVTLDLLSIMEDRDVKSDTLRIMEEADGVKDDSAQILEKIERLQSRLAADGTGGRSTEILQRYLDSLASYARTIRETSIEDDLK
ncbi:hypothetical protein BU23DRAFT_134301 [Bimuria novae-zelandiae CBS 107.79]|uniref:Uncharacterized protein n=1 Tax=Bimuria novae-zelandiae CBS 107.79 TaxID=1447943 RepID=A0A6A5VAE6_9PLEO|nr:hypothetical protein BU23DRAFT_134301 [Bimuria novae-zelandiae CBS 107.79]